jgi:hypothetical protein
MRKAIIAFGLVSLATFAGTQPVSADCRSENTACIKGSKSPFESVACGSLYRTCAANHALAAQQQVKQKHNANVPAMQNAPRSSGGHSGRR